MSLPWRELKDGHNCGSGKDLKSQPENSEAAVTLPGGECCSSQPQSDRNRWWIVMKWGGYMLMGFGRWRVRHAVIACTCACVCARVRVFVRVLTAVSGSASQPAPAEGCTWVSCNWVFWEKREEKKWFAFWHWKTLWEVINQHWLIVILFSHKIRILKG